MRDFIKNTDITLAAMAVLGATMIILCSTLLGYAVGMIDNFIAL